MAASQTYSIPEKTNDIMQKQQSNFVVISWNVLHIVHEINHANNMSPVITRYAIDESWSNEKLRLRDIT